METKKTGYLRKIGHSAALMFGAYWLVATTAVSIPPRECFKEIGNPATLGVVLGAPRPGVEGQLQSCQGIDGLVPGAALTFTIGSTEDQGGHSACILRDAQAIDGVQGVTMLGEPTRFDHESLTAARGEFSPSSSPACKGSWHVELAPELAPKQGQTISPLDAGPTQRWLVHRRMWFPSAELCDGPFAGMGDVQCEDEFVVESINEVTP